MSRFALLWVGLTLLAPAWAQNRVDGVHRVDPSAMYHRVYARVPVIGKGTLDDPKRPMFVPAPPSAVGRTSAIAVADRTGILSYQMHLSDDGKWALVEFVGATPKELQHITDSKDPNVKVFERGKTTKEDVEAEFQKYKKDFKFETFTTRVQ